MAWIGVVAVLLSLGATARADEPAGIEYGGLLGVHAFSQDGLGRNASVSAGSSLASNIEFGLRLGYPVSRRVAVELETSFAFTETEDRLAGAFVAGYRLDLTWTFARGALRPFALVGLGGETAVIDRATTEVATLPQAALGGGFTIPLGPRAAFRADARLLVGPGSLDAAVAVDAQLLVGFCFAPGGSCGVPPPVAPRRGTVAPPPERDGDGDGIFGSADRCPLRPEDEDGYDDEDGCPDLDDDQDGVDLPGDRCPSEAETRNGWEDQDGCPDQLPDDAAALEGPAPGLVFVRDGAILDDRSRPAIARLVEVLNAYPTLRLQIAAHVGKGAELARERADVVRAVLIEAGIDGERLDATIVEDTADDGLELRFVP